MANSGKDYCGGFQLEKQSTEEGNPEHILCSGFTHGPSSSTQQMREARRIWRQEDVFAASATTVVICTLDDNNKNLGGKVEEMKAEEDLQHQ